ncbi:NmrA family NAD(P)-binding protein [Spirosoma validum]|uniref:NmrA family NAD(P)-binding protein n=1 Tax=Spirosoma validum TaxID=2771355 RepID=A0A927B796_9BACT|nr:NmrA family NAD(P)-binding protein [Spirosoma validum]MBD2756674.1 NmrA family NAD(P)-binding protein [Spirosoma validum]
MATTILVAGATGNLGGRIVRELLKRGAEVRALVRPSSDEKKVDALKQQGVQIAEADTSDVVQLTKACEGVSCVVSALQGLRDVLVDTQSRLVDAAIEAGVPRFISSDFATDFTKQAAGENRNFDLRKEFMAYIDKKPIAATSIMNGAFAEILFYGTPLLDFKNNQVGYWENPDWRIDFTTMDNIAAFTAAAALDESTPRILRIASFQLSPNELANVAQTVTHANYHVVRLGSLEELAAYNKRERAAHPEGEQEVYPRWQQSQYQQSMFTAQHETLDNERYPDIQWTSAQEWLSRR